MNDIRISAIAAIGENRELGKNGDLIWRLRKDFDRMKKLIKGHTLIMGRKTYESIGREMPYSPCVVITRDTSYTSPFAPTKHTYITDSLKAAVAKATLLEKANRPEDREIFIFGGAHIYTEALPLTQRLYLTKIAATDPEADTFFPSYDEFITTLEKTAVTEGDLSFEFLTLERS